jgi:hypothetical protein
MAKFAWNEMQNNGLPSYPVPALTILRLIIAAGFSQKRSFHHDACKMIAPVSLRISGEEWIPSQGGYLLTINHYSRPGFGIWWAIAAISAIIQPEIYWIMASNWTYPGQKREKVLLPLTHYAFKQISSIYNFATMPPMPPDPKQVEERALAVRKVVSYLRKTPSAIVGMAPEGMDLPSGNLGEPPSGSGRFVHQMTRMGFKIIPIGIFEESNTLCINFGPCYVPEPVDSFATDILDRRISFSVMSHIAMQLPQELRGNFIPPN